jgi:peptide/nickel transport system substrate-binding protein
VKKRFFKLFVVSVLAFSLVFSGFGGLNTADAARKGFDPKKVGGKLVFTSFSDAARLTPYTTSDAVSNRIQGLIFDTLVSTDIKNNIIPSVATSWKIENGNKKFTFKLRKDVKFHDGKPLTADDVVFSFEMYKHPDSINPYKGDFENITKVYAPDKYTVVLELSIPQPLFLYTAGIMILPKHKFPNGVKDFNDSKFHRNPIGSGPFKFKEWKTAERIVVVANKDYWDGRPYLDEIVMKIVPDSNVEVLNLLKDQVDFVETVAPANVATLTKDKDVKVVKYDQGRFDFIGFNLENPKFSDVRVRQALTYGLNRQAIVDKIMLKNAQLASGPIHPLEAPYNKDVKPFPYDPEKAKKLLDEAGWKMGKSGYREKDGKILEIELSYNNGNKIREAVAKVAQADWKKIGVKTTIRSWDFQVMLDKIDAGELEGWILAWLLGTDPDKYGLWHSSQIPPGNNSSRVKDKRVDEIVEKFRQEADPVKRNNLYKELHKIMNEQQYNLFTYYPKGFAAMDKDLGGVQFSLYSRWFSVIDWYWTNPAKRK